MKKIRIILALSLIVLFSFVSLAGAQMREDVQLFQSYQYDATISSGLHGEAGLLYVNYKDAEVTETIIAARGGYPINGQMEVVVQLAYVNITPENWDALKGLADLGIFGRYNFYKTGTTAISAGPFLTLPIGEEDVGQGNFDYGAFCAMRHALAGGLVLTGNLGLEFYETMEFDGFDVKETYENQILLGVGVIYPLSNGMHVIGEFYMKGDEDYSVLSGAVDYPLGPGRLRAGFGLGLDDGAPDLMIAGGYAINLTP